MLTSGTINLSVFIINCAGVVEQIGTCIDLNQLVAGSTDFIGFNFTPTVPFVLMITLNITQTYITPLVYINGQSNPNNIAPISTSVFNPMYISSIQLSNSVVKKCL